MDKEKEEKSNETKKGIKKIEDKERRRKKK